MPDTKKLDLHRQHRAEYVAPKTPALVPTKPASYLTITGQGEPHGDVFQAAVSALYAVAFTIKMTSKQAGRDYKVCHLEGLWWGGKGTAGFWSLPPEQWKWKLMIRVPPFVGRDDLDRAVGVLKAKGKAPEVTTVRLEGLDEGLCVQVLHVGPYSEEPATVAKMRAFARENGRRLRGRHHEIYLSDPRRVPPQRLRTILRHPVR